MSTTTALLAMVGCDRGSETVARAAIARAFPGAEVATCDSVATALALPEGGGAEILVLTDPGAVAAAAAAVTSQRLPRWAVVLRAGLAEPAGDAIAPALWQTDFLVPLFRLAWARQSARRDCEQFRGDLRAIGTRITHDLRSPLGGILSTAEALGESLRTAAPAEAARTERIIESEEEVLQLVRTLSTLTSAFTTPALPLPFNMGAAAGAALQRWEPRLIVRQDRVSAPAAWPEVCGDERKCELVWSLLLHNVLKHTRPGRSVTLAWQPDGPAIRFSIADNGEGVPAERRGLLFWPFHRLHEPQAARGLGLPMMERLVRIQGGRCLFEALPDGGAVFGFTLPKAD